MLAPHNRYTAHAFLPAIPSPLSPRSSNIHAAPPPYNFFAHSPVYMSDASSQVVEKENTLGDRTREKDGARDAFSFTFPGEPATAAPMVEKPLPYSLRARTAKKAPLPKHDELRERRRGSFLRNVRERRDDDRWEARGEDVLRAEWMRERRLREEELAVSAPEVEGQVMIDAEEEMQREAEAEEWAGWEDGEMEELIRMAPAGGKGWWG